MSVWHVATIAAYPIKAALGGGFRGVMKIDGGDRIASDRLETLPEARQWAQKAAWDRYGSKPGYGLAALRRRGEYQANVWIQA